jgi:hypothetical protein
MIPIWAQSSPRCFGIAVSQVIRTGWSDCTLATRRAFVFRYVIRVVSGFQYMPSLSFSSIFISSKDRDWIHTSHHLRHSVSLYFGHSASWLTSVGFHMNLIHASFTFTSYRSILVSKSHHFWLASLCTLQVRPRPVKYEECQEISMSLEWYDSWWLAKQAKQFPGFIHQLVRYPVLGHFILFRALRRVLTPIVKVLSLLGSFQSNGGHNNVSWTSQTALYIYNPGSPLSVSEHPVPSIYRVAN